MKGLPESGMKSTEETDPKAWLKPGFSILNRM